MLETLAPDQSSQSSGSLERGAYIGAMNAIGESAIVEL